MTKRYEIWDTHRWERLAAVGSEALAVSVLRDMRHKGVVLDGLYLLVREGLNPVGGAAAETVLERGGLKEKRAKVGSH